MTEKTYLVYWEVVGIRGKKRDPKCPTPLIEPLAKWYCDRMNSLYTTMIWSYE